MDKKRGRPSQRTQEGQPFVTVQQDVNKIVNKYLTKERMESRKKILQKKFRDGVFD